jgi:hypothetical protein
MDFDIFRNRYESIIQQVLHVLQARNRNVTIEHQENGYHMILKVEYRNPIHKHNIVVV